MPRPSQYTPSRRVMMQAVMWLVLGGTVAVAAVISRVRYRPVELQPPQAWGWLQVRVPKGWAAAREGFLPVGQPMVLAAREPARGGEHARVVTFYQQQTLGVTPAKYLTNYRGARVARFEAFTFGGQEGIKALALADDGNTPEGDEPRVAVWACTVSKSGFAVAIRIVVEGLPGRDDEQLLQRLADGVVFNQGALTAPAPDDAPPRGGRPGDAEPGEPTEPKDLSQPD